MSDQTEPVNEQEQIVEPDTEALDFNRPDFTFLPKQHHDWRQKGPYLVCKSCEIEHGVWVGMDRILVGLNDQGQPILKPR